METNTFDLSRALTELDSAEENGELTELAAANIRRWLTEAVYEEYAPAVAEHIAAGKWNVLDDVFWTVIPFGTGGRRGGMYPIGTNAINDRTIGESAQGLANYINSLSKIETAKSCAIAYDTRHRSRDFAELCSEIMVAAGFQVFFLNGYRSTPELSFAVRHQKCACGIMVTASHNPPSDNAVKVYWSTGGQLLPPHDSGVIEQVQRVQTIERIPFADALRAGKVVYCENEVDSAFLKNVKSQSLGGPRAIKIVYSPLHGVGASCVCPALEADGFNEVEVYSPHAEPSGDFPNVPGNVANPENPEVFDEIVEYAKKTGADIVIATDPDCDRLGCAAPVTSDSKGQWRTFTGNQIGALLADFILDRRRQAGTLTSEHYVVKTLVTTELIRRIADSYGVTTHGNLLVGFKWIAGLIDELGPDKFVLGTEESHGYQAGTYTRDKDGAVASMLLAELAAAMKSEGKSLHEKLDDLFWQHGCHAEKTVSATMPGSEGMQRMTALMKRMREAPPRKLADMSVRQVRDYGRLKIRDATQRETDLQGPRGDLVFLDLKEEGNYVAVRPSGTEPKVKFYLFTFVPAEQLADLADAKSQLSNRLESLERDLKSFAENT